MAIHVRHKREALIRMRNRLLVFALSVSLLSLLVGAVSLYLSVEYWGGSVPSFESVVYVGDDTDAPQERKRPSQSAPSAKQVSVSAAVSPSVIAADAVADIAMNDMNLTDGLDFGADSIGLAGGFSLDVGTGIGGGNGRGNGGGNGDGGGGRGRHGAGLNNDIQIVLALDASGSMDALFTALSASMGRIVSTLQRSTINGRRASVNVGVVTYGAAQDNGKPQKLCDFTTKVDQLRRELDKVSCDGSEERCGEAIAFAEEHFPWNRRQGNQALKVLILAGNETIDQGDLDFRQAVARLRGSDIILNAVYCGPEGQETDLWKEAARRGSGDYVQIDQIEESPQQDAAALNELIRRLATQPVWALGSPAEQEAHNKEYQKLIKGVPNKDDKLADWVREDGVWVTAGLPWDAAELVRRMGEDASLARLGGTGNLPASLRGRTEEEVLSILREAAQNRAQLLQELESQLNGAGDLCSQILRAIRSQARERGIEMKL